MTETELEYQFCFNCNDRKQCYTKPKDCTRIQEEIGEMTNEEWFCGLSTKKKAEWLEEKMTWAAQEQGTFTAKGWEMWLKQPHTAK